MKPTLTLLTIIAISALTLQGFCGGYIPYVYLVSGVETTNAYYNFGTLTNVIENPRLVTRSEMVTNWEESVYGMYSTPEIFRYQVISNYIGDVIYNGKTNSVTLDSKQFQLTRTFTKKVVEITETNDVVIPIE